MIEVLKTNNKIIINSDIDGVLSGLILQHFLGCEIVGFCNSDNKLWICQNELSDYSKFVFIDMYVNNPKITCIDQHIVSFNELHNDKIRQQKNKINPNVIRGRYFYPNQSYYSKYPFGTVHFIIAELERSNINLESIRLFSTDNGIPPIDFFLRADDTLLTSVEKYKENAKDWWDWLLDYSSNGGVTNNFIDYIYSGINARENKRNVEQFLLGSPFYCKKPDGGFNEILGSNGELLPNFISYLNYIADITNLKRLAIQNDYKVLEGIPKRINFTHDHFEEFFTSSTVTGHKVFSYAFVKSHGKENSFSFTYFLK